LIDLLGVVLIAVFNTLNQGIDTITDFSVSVVDETIEVSAAGFWGGLTAGTPITAAQFKLGTAAVTLVIGSSTTRARVRCSLILMVSAGGKCSLQPYLLTLPRLMLTFPLARDLAR